MSFYVSRRAIVAGAIGSVMTLVAALSAARAETQLNVAVVSRTVFYLPTWIAQQKGFFKAAGLNVNVKVYDSSDPIFQDIRAGLQQIAIASTESVIADAYHGGAAGNKDACRSQGKIDGRGVDARGHHLLRARH
jgi:ABC-type nitrate/sulfonate/bicarbonate transport system substrate-binding protein